MNLYTVGDETPRLAIKILVSFKVILKATETEAELMPPHL
jgi:hypothetical protein